MGSLDNVGHLPAGGAVKVASGSPVGRSWGGAGCLVDSGSPQVGAVTAPQSLQSHVSTIPLLFPHHRQSRARQERGRDPSWRQSLFREPWPSLLSELISAIFGGTVGWGTGPPKAGGPHGTVVHLPHDRGLWVHAPGQAPLQAREQNRTFAHSDSGPGVRLPLEGLPVGECRSLGGRASLSRLAGPPLPALPLAFPASLLPQSCEILCVPRGRLSCVPCLWRLAGSSVLQASVLEGSCRGRRASRGDPPVT